jgi:hypothetical protein
VWGGLDRLGRAEAHLFTCRDPAFARWIGGSEWRGWLNPIGDHHQLEGDLYVGALLQEELLRLGKLFVEGQGQAGTGSLGADDPLKGHGVVAVAGGECSFEEQGARAADPEIFAGPVVGSA